MEKRKIVIVIFLLIYLLSMCDYVSAQSQGIDPELNKSEFYKDSTPKEQFQYVSNFLWYSPTGKGKLQATSGIGTRNLKYDDVSKAHHGTDFVSAFETLYAPMGGIVYTDRVGGGGRYVLIDHENGFL